MFGQKNGIDGGLEEAVRPLLGVKRVVMNGFWEWMSWSMVSIE